MFGVGTDNQGIHRGGELAGPVGFAAAWGENREETWSGTPFRLLTAMQRAAYDVVELGVQLPKPLNTVLKLAHVRRTHGRWVSSYRHGEVTRRLMLREIVHAAAATRCRAVVQIQDIGRLPVPYLLVQDLSYDILLDHYTEQGTPHFPALRHEDLVRLRDRQRQVYDDAAMLLPMSQWMARDLVRRGVPADRVRPIHPGMNTPVPLDTPVPERRANAVRRLLFVGRDPHTKGLDVALSALAVLRADGEPVTLTVAGPTRWPYAETPPQGVTFLGPQSREAVNQLMHSHDLFVMPSRLEGFGIAFVEALSRGLPCIARDAFAMTEIIGPEGGRLVSGEDPMELANCIAKALDDDELYELCGRAAPAVRRYYTWERAAREVLQAVDEVTEGRKVSSEPAAGREWRPRLVNGGAA